MARVLVTLDGRAEVGGTPLLCHNERLADPLDPITIEIAKLSGQRKKTEAIHLEIARLEFAGGLYHDEEIGPYLPTWNIVRCIEDGGKRFKLGADVMRAVIPAADRSPIEYDGPRDIGAMWEDGRFVSRKGVGISGRRVIRTRPVFVEWKVVAELELDLDVMTPEKIDQCVFGAGKYSGIGDNRPVFGRFHGSARLAPAAAKAKVNKRVEVTA
jgi:hypothetical protein